eukprot:TRINITY_DN95273_c0_g1_i1.p1 TRINITY_DN95273_c0_g1~~TRINITY_DN95273_c0_g1_i1.p1  ORF type:complete len:322 (+),score=46.32 TRINITY_DN95273_c0_g1_i1:88-1053(+)
MYGNMMAPKMAPYPAGHPAHDRMNFPIKAAAFGILMLVCFILAVVGTAIPDWAHGDVTFATTPPTPGQRKIGLWELCGQASRQTGLYSDSCENLMSFVKDNCPPNKDNFRWMQAFAVVICLCFMFAICVVPAGVLMLSTWVTAFGCLLIFFGFLFALILLIGFVDQILDEDWPCVKLTEAAVANIPDGSLGLGWAFMLIAAIVAFICLLIAAWLVYNVMQTNQRKLYYGTSPVYSPMYTPPLSPVGDYRSYSPVNMSPPPPPVMVPAVAPAMGGALDDPLLARVEAVKGRLRRTLADDAGRMMAVTPPPQVYVPPQPFSFY